jgi:hypothetical protein
MDNTDMGLFQSTDGGKSWQTTSEGVPDDWRNTTYWLAFDPTQRGLIWGAFSGQHDLPRPKDWRNNSPQNFKGGVAVSTDGGHHWQPSITGMPVHSITHILLDPSSPAGSRTLLASAFTNPLTTEKPGRKRITALLATNRSRGALRSRRTVRYISWWHAAARARITLRPAPERSIARRTRLNTGSAWTCLQA